MKYGISFSARALMRFAAYPSFVWIVFNNQASKMKLDVKCKHPKFAVLILHKKALI